MTKSEIEQLESLLEVLKAGDTATAIEWLEAAIAMLKKETR